MQRLIFTAVFLLTERVGLSATISTTTTYYDPADVHDVPTNLSLRETVFGITNYACGSNGFCSKDLATQPGGYCLSCPMCRCDSECLLYGDCCPDLLFEADDVPIKPSEYVSCRVPHLKCSTCNNPPPIYMYTSCPKDFNSNIIKMKCAQPSKYYIDEVTLVSVGNDTYRNKYCAMCHGKHSYTTWHRTVQCPSSDIPTTSVDKNKLWKLAIDNDGCFIHPIIPIETQCRLCQARIIGKCNTTVVLIQTDSRSEMLCGLYYHPVIHNTIWYKNIFCAICNGVVLSRNVTCNTGIITEPVGTGSYPLSVLIDFNPKPRSLYSLVSVNEEPVTRIRCDVTSIYDPFSHSCQKALCSVGRIISEGECETIFQSSSGLGYSGSVSLQYPHALSMSTWQNIIKLYTVKLKEYLRRYKPFVLPSLRIGTIIKEQFPPLENNPLSLKAIGGRVDFNFISTHPGDQHSLEDSLRKVHEIEITFDYDGKKHSLTTQPIFCPDELGYDSENGEQILTDQFSTPGFEICGDNCNFRNVAFTPIFSIMRCSFLEYNLSMSNFTFNAVNQSLEVDNLTFPLQNDQFGICGDVIKICKSALLTIEGILTLNRTADSKNNSTSINRVSVSPALTIVSIICITLSLMCLLLTFIVYCLLPSLRTLPGKNTMVLVAYLFFAQLFFQVGIKLNYDQKLCRTMGVLIHYLWLATFTSMGVCAFHMHSVFTKMAWSTYPERANCNTFALYLLVVNLVPLILVGTCVAYHMGLSRGVEIGYGEDICFMRNSMDIGIFFAAPLGIMLLFNTYCFIRVVMAIRNVPDMAMTKNAGNRNHLHVYFRLSGLLGFAWVFGFIGSATQFEGLWYAFIVLNGLQGVFICLAYCGNKRTWSMFRDAYACKPSEKYETGHKKSSSMPTTLGSSHSLSQQLTK